jgi:hypothetical protein
MILCDSRGSVFGAFYARKKFIFLKTLVYGKILKRQRSITTASSSKFSLVPPSKIEQISQFLKDEHF